MTQQIAVSHGDTLGGQLVYRQALPVSIFNFIKRSQEPVIKLQDPQAVTE